MSQTKNRQYLDEGIMIENLIFSHGFTATILLQHVAVETRQMRKKKASLFGDALNWLS